MSNKPAGNSDWLDAQFTSLCKQICDPCDCSPLLIQLRQRYSEPQRHYHNLRHIEVCLNEFIELQSSAEHPESVAFAIFYHDVIYDPHQRDNEERSAGVAIDALRRLRAPPPFVNAVHSLILATRHTTPPQTPDERLLVDIDLTILGKPRDVFEEYERAIRQEYAHVPDAQFAQGRAKVLKAFLQRPAIYSTAECRIRYEQGARDNIERSIRQLRKGILPRAK